MDAALLAVGEQVGRALLARGETVGVAEGSCGGLVSAALLAVPGASGYYAGGAVTVLVLVYLFVNLFVDLLYGVLDPRISHD